MVPGSQTELSEPLFEDLSCHPILQDDSLKKMFALDFKLPQYINFNKFYQEFAGLTKYNKILNGCNTDDS